MGHEYVERNRPVGIAPSEKNITLGYGFCHNREAAGRDRNKKSLMIGEKSLWLSLRRPHVVGEEKDLLSMESLRVFRNRTCKRWRR